MTKPTLYLDHDVHLYFAAALERHGYEAHSTQEFSNQSLPDDAQLAFATQRNWTLLGYNTSDFFEIHHNGVRQDKAHAGIILASQFNPKRPFRRPLHLLFLSTLDDLRNQVVFLGAWLDL